MTAPEPVTRKTPNLPQHVRCRFCGVGMVKRPENVQTPEQLATGPWWDHPPIPGATSTFGHTYSLTFGGAR